MAADPLRRNWLERYLQVQSSADKRMSDALRAAAKDAERAIDRVAGGSGVGAKVRASQLAQAKAAIHEVIRKLYVDAEEIIREGQGDAAVAAVEAFTNDESRILKVLFPNKTEREAWIASLEQTARRNVQSMMTRVLKTERPLSRRVYRSRALSMGMVDRSINSSLARGLGPLELAKEVQQHISPDSPGGVGYAAKRLGRTEINNAFHAQAQNDAVDRPWVEEMQWNLSKSHREQGCVCEQYAIRRLFPVDQVPDKPHPNCFCYVTPQVIPVDIFSTNLKIGLYNDWLDRADAA